MESWSAQVLQSTPVPEREVTTKPKRCAVEASLLVTAPLGTAERDIVVSAKHL